MKRRCECCGTLFSPRNDKQRYSNNRECQRKRRNKWQREKRATDSAYRADQADAQRVWREKNLEYMREYRQRHPEYVKRNREQQRQRRASLKASESATASGVVKMDARTPQPTVISGTYKLLPLDVVKMDVITVQLSVLEGFS